VFWGVILSVGTVRETIVMEGGRPWFVATDGGFARVRRKLSD
jgi:hypothetical protein